MPRRIGAAGGRFALVGGREDTPLDLAARGFGLGLGQRTGAGLALDLGQLVAIDGEVVIEPRRGAMTRAQQRHEQRANRRGGEKGEAEFEHG